MVESAIIKSLLEAGVHFGHEKKRWNPKMKKYIFGEKSGVYIIDLQKTEQALLKACAFLKGVAASGGRILFVGTKRQAQDIIKTEALRAGMSFVNQRWLGGMLTNYQTIRKSIKRLEDLERMKTDGTFDELSKKEVSQLTKEMVKLNKNLEGVRDMGKLPKAMVVVDSKKEEIAVKEARVLGIPIVALADTNCNPDIVDYVIPGNDDAIRSIKLIVSVIADNVLQGKEEFAAGEAAKAREAAAAAEEAEESAEETIKVVDEKIEELVEGDLKLKDEEKPKDEPIKRTTKKKPIK